MRPRTQTLNVRISELPRGARPLVLASRAIARSSEAVRRSARPMIPSQTNTQQRENIHVSIQGWRASSPGYIYKAFTPGLENFESFALLVEESRERKLGAAYSPHILKIAAFITGAVLLPGNSSWV